MQSAVTTQAVRNFRQPSRLEPTAANASPRLRATYTSWSGLMTSYRVWAAGQENPEDPAGKPPVTLAWVRSFDQFVEDMGLRPEDTVLVLTDPALPAAPGNCSWGAIKASKRCGRPPGRWLTHDGETLSVRAWAERLSISAKTIYTRLGRGATTAEALSPIRRNA
jgi:hypothetical protein